MKSYKKWILSRKEIEKVWKERNLELDKEIMEIEDELLKNKYAELWKFIIVNFSEDLKDGLKQKQLRTALYKYINYMYTAEIDGVEDILELFQRRGLLNLYDDQTIEGFVSFSQK